MSKTFTNNDQTACISSLPNRHNNKPKDITNNSAFMTTPLILAMALSLGGIESAWAVDECGAENLVDPADTITCPAGAYPAGITYVNSDGLTLELNDATITAGGLGVSVTAAAASTGDVSVSGSNYASIITTAPDAIGLSAVSAGDGATRVQMDAGTMNLSGDNAFGLFSSNFHRNSDCSDDFR